VEEVLLVVQVWNRSDDLLGGTIIMQIPVFLLRKLYVKGSLENTDDGFLFKIKNSLSPGTAISMDALKVNGNEYGLDKTLVTDGTAEISAAEISESNSFQIKVGVEITVKISGDPLPEGEHTLDIGIVTKEAGKLAFDVKDAI
jgi:hypothetical protein